MSDEVDEGLIRDGFAAIGENEKRDHLADFIASPSAVEYFGKAFALKADTLAALINHSSLIEVAQKHGVTDEAVYRHARKARQLFTQFFVG